MIEVFSAILLAILGTGIVLRIMLGPDWVSYFLASTMVFVGVAMIVRGVLG